MISGSGKSVSDAPDRTFGATGLLKICFFNGARRFAPGTIEKTLIWEREKEFILISKRSISRIQVMADLRPRHLFRARYINQ